MSVVTAPDPIWSWAQRKSGKINPASYLREVWWAALIADVEGAAESPAPAVAGETDNEHRWSQMDLGKYEFDDEFNDARDAFVSRMGGEERAIEWFSRCKERGIHSPRAWLISWWRKERPGEAV